VGGRNPAGYHAVNLALHLIAVVLVWVALKRLISPQAALIATAIFAVHPFQAEPVNYIFARSTLLATVFCLASLVLWTRGKHWWATIAFAAALLSKEECVAFPALLLLLDRRQWRPIATMFLLSLAAGVRVILATSNTLGSGAGIDAGISASDYLFTQGFVILRYLRMLPIPWGFTVDPDVMPSSAAAGALAWGAVLAIAGFCAIQWRRGHRAGLWFIAGLILLLPSSSIFPASDLAADRRMYLPMVAFAACAGLLLERVRSMYLAFALLVLTGLSVERTAIWRTEESLWTDAVEKAPRKVRPKIQLSRASPPQPALEILEQAKAIAPEDPRIASELGRRYLELGKPMLALPEFGRALALEPKKAEAYNNRGAALLALDQREVARQDFERALSIDPCQYDARVNLKHLGFDAPVPVQCKFSAQQREALH
jgi:protein O-mannosyl-transferase